MPYELGPPGELHRQVLHGQVGTALALRAWAAPRDKGYDDPEVPALLREFGFTAHICPHDAEAKELKKGTGRRVQRWVVERSHSWMNRFHGLLVR